MTQKQLPCTVCGEPVTVPAKYAKAKSATCGKCRQAEQSMRFPFLKKDAQGWTFMSRPWNKEIAKQERLTAKVIDRLCRERGYSHKSELYKQRYHQEAVWSWQNIANFVCGVAIMSGVAYVVLPGGLIFEGSPVRGDSPTMSPLVQ